jgi:hypothetical protein
MPTGSATPKVPLQKPPTHTSGRREKERRHTPHNDIDEPPPRLFPDLDGERWQDDDLLESSLMLEIRWAH